MFTCAGESRNVPLEDIQYFEVKHNIITVYYQKEKFEFYSTIGKLEDQLQKKGFIRIHRSFMVAKKFIRQASYTELELTNGTLLPVGQVHAKQLRKEMKAKRVSVAH